MDKNKQLNIYTFLNSLNAKEGSYRHAGDKELEFYFRKSQEIIYMLLDENKLLKGEKDAKHE